MKYIVKLTLGLLLGIGFLASCDDESDNKSVGFALDKDEITIGNDGGIEQLSVSANGKWYASTDASWIKITPANGIGSGECTISVDSTVEAKMREATIRIMAEGEAPKKVSVYQIGYKKGIYLHQADTTIENSAKANARFLVIKVTTNVKFNVKIQNPTDVNERISWIEYDEKNFDLDYGDRPRTVQLRFNWSVNMREEMRTAKILFTPTDEEAQPEEMTVNQKAAPLITDDRAGDSLALLAVSQMMNRIFEEWDTSENMQYWNGVKLWEKTDKEVKNKPYMIGRVRKANFYFFDTKESIPYQISKLKYVESLGFYSNVNKSFKDIEFDPETLLGLQYLKNLEIGTYGINQFKDSFKELGKQLVSLDISGNNLEELPWWLNSYNFPELTTLKLNSMRRWDTVKDLQNPSKDHYGLHLDASDEYGSFMQLMTWEKLDTLNLSYCYIEGELLEELYSFPQYTQQDISEKKLPAILLNTPKVLPNTRFLSINLNFLNGKFPSWLRYHPHLSDWDPFVLIFNQDEGKNSKGKKTGFSDAPKDWDYYYELYPDKKPNYE